MPVVIQSQKRKKCERNRVQVQRAVGLVAVQVDGDAGDGDVGHHQGHEKHLPPGGAGQAVANKLKHKPSRQGKGPESEEIIDFLKRRPPRTAAGTLRPVRLGAAEHALDFKVGVKIHQAV
jgi:hypothetical protein